MTTTNTKQIAKLTITHRTGEKAVTHWHAEADAIGWVKFMSAVEHKLEWMTVNAAHWR